MTILSPRASQFSLRFGIAIDGLDRCRLRAGVAHLLIEANFGADLETLETGSEHAVAMKIQLASLGGCDEAIARLRKQPGHTRYCCRFVSLDAALHHARMIFELPP